MMVDARKTPNLVEARPDNPVLIGLTQVESARLLEQYGPNAIPEEKIHTWLVFLHKMWAPVPWMLEASIVLELVLGKYIEAGVSARW